MPYYGSPFAKLSPSPSFGFSWTAEVYNPQLFAYLSMGIKPEHLGKIREENWNMKDFSLFFHKKLNILTFS